MSDPIRTIDSFRYLSPASAKIVKTMIAMAPRDPVPWTPLPRPLGEATVALISTAGLSMLADPPFDAEGEQQNPWWGTRRTASFPVRRRPLGQPNDTVTQRAVLGATLDALRDAAVPGTVVHLLFDWPELPAEVHWHPKEPSPILQLLAGDPSLFQRLVAGDIPPEASRRNRERTPS